MNHIMLDLETFGTKPNSVIVSIGAVQFDMTGKTGKEFYCNVNPSSCLYYGLEVDGRTIMWWLEQEKEARKALTKNQLSLKPALEDFNKFYNKCHKGSFIWGNGSTFDNTILSNAYDKTMLRKPWGYNKDCDMRTIVAVGENILGIDKNSYKRKGVYHNALDDAKHQAMIVSDIYGKLSNRK